MELLSLTLAELLAFVVPISAALAALYFYDRSRRRRVVSTLRFWPRRPVYLMTTRHRRLQQPWSLLLQLLAALFILLAIADLRFSGSSRSSRHHVVILETSAWMSAVAVEGQSGTLLDRARDRASAFLDALPVEDPVLLIQGDANPMVVQGFTTNRTAFRESLDALQPSWTAANLADAVELAKSVLRLATFSDGAGGLETSNAVGEIVYIGGGRVSPEVLGRIDTSDLPFMRYIAVGEEVDDVGLTRVSAQREPSDPRRWRVVAEVHNHSNRPRPVRLNFEFEQQRLGYKVVAVPAAQAQEVVFHLGTERAGVLSARLAAEDRFAGNNQASLDLPPFRTRVVRFASRRGPLWRPLLSATPAVRAVFGASSDTIETDLEVFDRTAPDGAQGGLFIEPPRSASPIPVARSVGRTRITQWVSHHPIATGLRTQDLLLPRTLVFAPEPGDVVVAEAQEGPVVVAREMGGRKTVVYGFDPLESRLANRLVTPLLFANTLRWFSPDLFLSRQVLAGSPGLVETPVDAEDESEVAVRSAETSSLPWSLKDGRLRFFMPTPGNVEVKTPFRETGWSLTLPELGTARWEPPEGTLRGVPPPSAAAAGWGFPLWPWLALLAVVCWLIDWTYYGRVSPPRSAAAVPASAGRFNPITLGGPGAAQPPVRDYGPVRQRGAR